MLLHARFIANLGARKMVIVSPDTDVLVLLLHHFGSLGVHEVYLKTGRRSTHSDLTRYIPVHEVVKKLTLSQLEILLTVYCLTGCDTCSSFFGIGKKKVFKIIMNTGTANELHILANIGKGKVPSKEELKACIYFVGLLYGATHCDSLNKLRVDKVLKIKRVKPRKLPPTDDSFSLHLLRCIYQLLIWKGCLTAMLDMPDPTEFGYMVDTDTGLYRPHVMSQSVAPPELLSDLVCECSDFCNEDCVCSANEQPCTHACECKGCVDDVDDICKNIFTILAQVTSDTNSEFEW